jgi:hypothetical protein
VDGVAMDMVIIVITIIIIVIIIMTIMDGSRRGNLSEWWI